MIFLPPLDSRTAGKPKIETTKHKHMKTNTSENKTPSYSGHLWTGDRRSRASSPTATRTADAHKLWLCQKTAASTVLAFLLVVLVIVMGGSAVADTISASGTLNVGYSAQVCVLPVGASNISVVLQASVKSSNGQSFWVDHDIQLFDGPTKGLGYGGTYNFAGKGTFSYSGISWSYSGYNGSSNPGYETLSSSLGKLTKALTVKVASYQNGDYTAKVSFTPAILAGTDGLKADYIGVTTALNGQTTGSTNIQCKAWLQNQFASVASKYKLPNGSTPVMPSNNANQYSWTSNTNSGFTAISTVAPSSVQATRTTNMTALLQSVKKGDVIQCIWNPGFSTLHTMLFTRDYQQGQSFEFVDANQAKDAKGIPLILAGTKFAWGTEKTLDRMVGYMAKDSACGATLYRLRTDIQSK
jgi:hypothetical protein